MARRKRRCRRNIAPQTVEMPRVEISERQAIYRAIKAVDEAGSKINTARHYLDIADLDDVADDLHCVALDLETIYDRLEQL